MKYYEAITCVKGLSKVIKLVTDPFGIPNDEIKNVVGCLNYVLRLILDSYVDSRETETE